MSDLTRLSTSDPAFRRPNSDAPSKSASPTTMTESEALDMLSTPPLSVLSPCIVNGTHAPRLSAAPVPDMSTVSASAQVVTELMPAAVLTRNQVRVTAAGIAMARAAP